MSAGVLHEHFNVTHRFKNSLRLSLKVIKLLRSLREIKHSSEPRLVSRVFRDEKEKERKKERNYTRLKHRIKLSLPIIIGKIELLSINNFLFNQAIHYPWQRHYDFQINAVTYNCYELRESSFVIFQRSSRG